MRKLFFLFTFCAGVFTAQAQTFNNGLTNTGGTGTAAVVRLGGTITTTSPVIDLGTTFTFGINKSTASYFSVINNGNIGIGVPTPLSILHIKAGSATAAPLLFTTGVNLTTPIAGAVEYNGTSLLFTPTTALGRKTLAYADLTNLSGVLPILNGGTSFSTYTTGDILYASAANVLNKRTIGTTNQVLTVVGGVPTWADRSLTAGVTGILPVVNGGTGAATNIGVLIGNGTAATTSLPATAGLQYLRRNAANGAYEFGTLPAGGTGTLTGVSIQTLNGFTGTATATATPVITIALAPTSIGLLKGTAGVISSAVAGTDYLTPTGSASGLTSFPTLNQSTTGTAANVSGVVALLNGGTGVAAATNVAALAALLPAQSVATNGMVLRSNGLATNATSWVAATGTGTVTAIGVSALNGVSGTSSGGATPNLTISLGAITPTSVAATGTVAGSNLSGTNTGDNAPNSLYSGLVSNAAHTGDVSGATALTLATVNSNVGSFTNANVTVNAKGLVTAVSNGVANNGFVPLQGTLVGNPISGNIEVNVNDGQNPSPFSIFRNSGTKTGRFNLLNGGSIGMQVLNTSPSNFTYFNLNEGDATFGSNIAGAVGLKGAQDFTLNISDLDYVQKKYVDNKINSKIDSTTASNGLNLIGKDVRLGGNLTQATTITNNANPLTIATGGTALNITGLAAGAATDSLVTVNTTTGKINRISPNSLSSGWGLNGNAGTSLVTDFIGTTDLKDFVIKTNNSQIARFSGNVNRGIAFGNGTFANGYSGTAMGYVTFANGFVSTATGASTVANGDYSTAMGHLSSANGESSTAMGGGTIASGYISTAMGSGTTATAYASTAIGNGTNASAHSSTAMGSATIANGTTSTAMGLSTMASGLASSAMGANTTASGTASTAMGQSTIASGTASTSMGLGTISKNEAQTVLGKYNDTTSTTSIFEIGNGTNNTARSNAMTVLKNGKLGIGTIAPDTTLHLVGKFKYQDGTQGLNKVLTSDANGIASWSAPSATTTAWGLLGNAGTTVSNFIGTTDLKPLYIRVNNDTIAKFGTQYNLSIGKSTTASGFASTAMGRYTNASDFATAMGAYTTASGQTSTAMGSSTIASGSYSTAMGNNTNASNYASTAMGNNTTASGYASTAIGETTNASDYASTAMGVSTTASGYASTAMGGSTIAKSSYSLVVGKYNDTTNTGRIFEIGIGEYNERANALTVLNTGNVGIGTTTPTAKLDIFGSLKITNGTQGINKVLTSDANGLASWQTPAGGTTSVTANNGLNISAQNIKLGGALTEPTLLQASSINTLSIKGLEPGEAPRDSFLVVDPNGKINLISSGDIIDAIEYSNGLTRTYYNANTSTNDGVKLGGVLTQATTINNSGFALNIAGATASTTFTSSGNLFSSGKIAIGTTDLTQIGTHSLAVNGTAIFTKATVKLIGNWPDYVFEPTFKLPKLSEVEKYLIENKHLVDMPSAAEVDKNGIDLGQHQTILTKKLEELTLYAIEADKKIALQQEQINALVKQQQAIADMQEELKKMKQKLADKKN